MSPTTPTHSTARARVKRAVIDVIVGARGRTRAASVACVLGSTLLTGCVHPQPPTAPAHTDRDESLQAHERAARARLATLGLEPTLRVRIVVAPTLDAFFAQAGVDEPLLRAWTVFDVVHLAPLSAWTDSSADAITQRLTHELCHAGVQQRFGTPDRARAARIPRFFEEGACSVAADQGATRLSLDDVRRTAVDTSEGAPLSVEAFAANAPLAYAASHHLMAAVVAHHGQTAIARIVDEAAADGTAGCVERAFERVTGRGILVWWRDVATVAGPRA